MRDELVHGTGTWAGFFTSLTVVLVQPDDGLRTAVAEWVDNLDANEFRAHPTVVVDNGGALATVLAEVDGNFVAVLGPHCRFEPSQLLDVIGEMFVAGGDAAVLGRDREGGDVVADVCRWLWGGGIGEEAGAIVIRRFAARWLFAGLEHGDEHDIEVQARAIGMALRIVVPGHGVVNPPEEWAEDLRPV